MKKLVLCVCCLLVLSVSPAPAQSGNPMTDSVKAALGVVKGYLTKTAEQVSEANYAFKPTPDVRSMGNIIGHVADSNFFFCSMASGAANPRIPSGVIEAGVAGADLLLSLEYHHD